MKRVIKKIENESVISTGQITSKDNVFAYNEAGDLVGMVVRKHDEDVWGFFGSGYWACEHPSKLAVIDDLMQPHRKITLYVA